MPLAETDIRELLRLSGESEVEELRGTRAARRAGATPC
jgi:hypothetical protein